MTHGVLKGLLLGTLRLLRCVGGLYTGGLDPVPERVTLRYLFGSYHTFFRFRRRPTE
jgi:putative component of membrane protein insertase Oxa1/YidC/SpoIIIJ protein YidD